MKLQDLPIPPTPTNIDGLYIRDVPMSEIEQFQQLEGDESILFLLQRICCDENGDAFEGVDTVDDIKNMGVLRLRSIVNAFNEALGTSGND